jgi:hypothetical protein
MAGASSVHLRRVRVVRRLQTPRGAMLLRAGLHKVARAALLKAGPAVRSRLHRRLFNSAPAAAAGEHPSPRPLEEGITIPVGAAVADIAASRSAI